MTVGGMGDSQATDGHDFQGPVLVSLRTQATTLWSLLELRGGAPRLGWNGGRGYTARPTKEAPFAAIIYSLYKTEICYFSSC